jgi:FAD-dependent urate hydroxylase
MGLGTNGRVLIIGGGPAGLATAVALKRVGIPAAIFEQAPVHLAVGSGIGVTSNSLKALMRLGVGQRLLPRGVACESFNFYSQSGRFLNRSPEGEVAEAWGPPSITVLRADLYNALAAELDTDTLQLGARFVGAEQDSDGVTARFDDGREERGSLLLGCDGTGSAVRDAMGLGGEPLYSGFISWRNVIVQEPEIVPEGEARLYIGRGKAFAMFPCVDRQVYIACSIQGPAAGKDAPGTVKRTLMSHFGGWNEPVRRALDAAEEAGFNRTDLYDRDPGPTWFKGRIALLGDAIHPTTPFIGQGASIAMEDGITLAKELAIARDLHSGADVEAALTAYQWRRRDRTAWIVEAARRRGKMCAITNRVAAAVRDRALRLMPEKTIRRELERIVFHEV